MKNNEGYFHEKHINRTDVKKLNKDLWKLILSHRKSKQKFSTLSS